MIEMLGVLAIVGVLSVGGIAGYTKAMEQIKINKTLSQYNLIINTMNMYKDTLLREKTPGLDLIPALIVLAELPEEMIKNNRVYDAMGHSISLNRYSTFIRLVISPLPYGADKTQSINFCRSIYRNIIVPNYAEIGSTLFGGPNYNWTYIHQGKKVWGSNKLNKLKEPEITKICKSCPADTCVLWIQYTD